MVNVNKLCSLPRCQVNIYVEIFFFLFYPPPDEVGAGVLASPWISVQSPRKNLSPDYNSQTLLDDSLFQVTPLVKVPCKSIHYFVSDPADRQTNKHTYKQTEIQISTEYVQLWYHMFERCNRYRTRTPNSIIGSSQHCIMYSLDTTGLKGVADTEKTRKPNSTMGSPQHEISPALIIPPAKPDSNSVHSQAE